MWQAPRYLTLINISGGLLFLSIGDIQGGKDLGINYSSFLPTAEEKEPKKAVTPNPFKGA